MNVISMNTFILFGGISMAFEERFIGRARELAVLALPIVGG